MDKILICFTMILGDHYRQDELNKCFESLAKAKIDHLYINYNGKSKKLNLSKDYLPITYEKFEWKEDFSLARNQSFSLVDREKYAWQGWIDSDDIFVTEEGRVQEMLESLDPYTEGIFLRYAYAVEPLTGIVVVEQWRERFLSTKTDWQWVFPIHEVCRGVNGVQYAKRDECYIEHQRKSGDDRGARERNRRIIAKALRENPDEPRFHFYFAGETLAEADATTNNKDKLELIEVALLEYSRFREMMGDLSDDVYLATCRIAELYRMKNDHAKAIEADLESIAIYPDWPDGYVGAAKSCLELGDWRRMRAFADMATKCNKPQTAASIEPMMAGFTPLFLRAIANEELGDIEQAITDYKNAKKSWNPPTGDLDKKLQFLEGLQQNKPTEERWHLRKKLRGTSPDKSICFFTQPIPDIWHPKTLEQGGSGGAETCIMKLAPMFAADGWRVVVFGTPGIHRGLYEGVEYWNTDEFLPSERFEVFISSRSYIPFEANVNADASFLWMHDVNIGPQTRNNILKANAMIGLTNWHANHLAKLYKFPQSKISVVPNGVDLNRFPKEKWDNDINRIIYSSSPDRGLDTLLSLWPLIKGRYPNIELHIYYGWEIIDKIIDMQKKRGVNEIHLERFKQKCLYQIHQLGGEDGGIYQHGRINQNILAEEMMKSTLWAYPTQFMETFCITAIEMQMAGVTPVTSSLAALDETVYDKYEKISGWPNNIDYQKRWLDLFAYSYENEQWRNEIRKEAREFAQQFSWENSYKIWNDLIKKYI